MNKAINVQPTAPVEDAPEGGDGSGSPKPRTPVEDALDERLAIRLLDLYGACSSCVCCVVVSHRATLSDGARNAIGSTASLTDDFSLPSYTAP